jgi:HMG-box domain
MSREDNWVAVAPEFASASGDNKIRRASSAYQFFQRDISETVKQELVRIYGSFDIAKHGRAVRDRWNALTDAEKEPYKQMQRDDHARFARESHAADIAAIERREKLQKEREMLLLDDEGGTKRTTRHKWSKKQRKKEAETSRKRKSVDSANEDHDFNDEEESSQGSFDSDKLSNSSEERNKKPEKQARQLTELQLERKAKAQQEKQEKEAYIAGRHGDLRKEKATQAKKRLEFLLKQSNIFSHFGQVQKTPRNTASRPLRRLELAIEEKTMKKIRKLLWLKRTSTRLRILHNNHQRWDLVRCEPTS